jgi:hypothetical protein
MIKFLLGLVVGSLVTFYVIAPNDDYSELYDESVGEVEEMAESVIDDISNVLDEPLFDSEATTEAVDKVREAFDNLQPKE